MGTSARLVVRSHAKGWWTTLLLEGQTPAHGLLATEVIEALPEEPVLCGRALGDALKSASSDLSNGVRALASSVDRTTLMVEVHAEKAEAMPWELLSFGIAPGEAADRFSVVRLVPQGRLARRLPRVGKLRAAWWAHDASDPVVMDAAADLPDDVVALESADTTPDVVLLLDTDAAAVSPAIDAPDSALSAALEQGAVVIASSSDGGETPLSSRLVAAGAVAVVAPVGEVGLPDASAAFRSSLLASLARGGTVESAIVASRGAVRRLKKDHWWRWSLSVCHPSQLEPLIRRPVPGLEAWPQPSAEAQLVLNQALRDAKKSGFFGMEHLVLGLVQVELSRPELAEWNRWVGSGVRWVKKELGTYRPLPTESLPTAPRLQRAIAELSEGFTVEQLFTALSRSVASPLHRWCEGLPPVRPEAETGEHVWALEVSGGPEDGARFEGLVDGTIVGRWDPDDPREGSLYNASCGATDPALSRSTFTIEGPGMIGVGRKAMERWRNNQVFDAAPDTELELEDADLLRCGRSTWLRVTLPRPAEF